MPGPLSATDSAIELLSLWAVISIRPFDGEYSRAFFTKLDSACYKRNGSAIRDSSVSEFTLNSTFLEFAKALKSSVTS